jgi:predicted PurR-regulated permease PerM
MPRGFFIPLVAFVLPFAIYWIYRFIQHRRQLARRDPWPVTILFLTGAVLAIQTFALTALTEPLEDKRRPDPPAITEDMT